jgi:hypothetical protein
VTVREGSNDWQDPFHPWRRPKTIGSKKPLHVHAEVNAAFRQRKGEELVAQSVLTRCMRLHRRSPHVQKNGFAVRDHDPTCRETEPLLLSVIFNDLETRPNPVRIVLAPK